MILHHRGTGLPIAEYGISVPIAPDRVGPILAALRANPRLGPRESEWLIGSDGTAITRDDLLRVNTRRYVDMLYSDDVESAVIQAFELVDENGSYHRYDPSRATQPLAGLFDRALRMVAGVYQCGKEALDRGFCFYCGGGSHHGHPDFGHGFCIINDSAIAVRRLQAEQRIATAWIIDVDVHKGDGTAAIMADDDSVITLSVHMAHGWPLDGPEVDSAGDPNPSYIPSDIDVPVDSGEEAEYLPRLEIALEDLAIRKAPEIAYVLAGADPYEEDGLASTAPMRLTLDQLNARNLVIYGFLKTLGVPQAWLMAGGYGERAWEPYPAILEHVLLDRLP